jgi:N,N-dimethylformamidase
MYGNVTGSPRSPVFAEPLEGYWQEHAVTAGGSAEAMLSGAGVAEVSLIRLIHGDPNPEGPGYRDEPVSWFERRTVPLSVQHLDLGSFVEIPHSTGLNPTGSFTLGLWLLPTRLSGDWQALAAKWGRDDAQFGLFCVGSGTLAGAVSLDGTSTIWCASRQYVEPGAWQFVAMAHDAEHGRITLYHGCAAARTELATSGWDGPALMESAKTIPAGPVHDGGGPLLFGALASPDTGHWAHFDGKLARPFLVSGALTQDDLARVREHGLCDLNETVLGAWNLSADVSSTRIVDASGNGRHGRAVGGPTRAVTGPAWSGTPATLYTDAPERYDAIHLHSDDLEDAGWPATLTVHVPSEARPGIYAARVVCRHDRLTLPLIVRAQRPTADLCVLLPTLTWQAYGSNRGPYSFTEDGVVDRVLCIYDEHADGTPVNYATRRKPTRSGDPSQGIRPWGTHNLPADLYLIDWLRHRGQDHDVLCDQDLHQHGADALRPYRCVMLGSHPEYWTSAMLSGLETYLEDGGRVMYLGGNGLYWVTSLDPERPHVMEVRKSGDGDYDQFATHAQPGQMQHSTTLETGGLWSRRARPARRLVGIEHAANVFVQAEGRWGFERLPDSYQPQYSFVFDGVAEGVFGDFGLNLGSAAGYEMDASHEWHWSGDWRPVVLAQARHPSFMSTMRMPVPRASEIALIAAPSGAAVFSAGSVTWTGSLSHNGYRNGVSTITENVLHRFLETPPGQPVVDPPPRKATDA